MLRKGLLMTAAEIAQLIDATTTRSMVSDMRLALTTAARVWTSERAVTSSLSPSST